MYGKINVENRENNGVTIKPAAANARITAANFVGMYYCLSKIPKRVIAR